MPEGLLRDVGKRCSARACKRKVFKPNYLELQGLSFNPTDLLFVFKQDLPRMRHVLSSVGRTVVGHAPNSFVLRCVFGLTVFLIVWGWEDARIL